MDGVTDNGKEKEAEENWNPEAYMSPSVDKSNVYWEQLSSKHGTRPTETMRHTSAAPSKAPKPARSTDAQTMAIASHGGPRRCRDIIQED